MPRVWQYGYTTTHHLNDDEAEVHEVLSGDVAWTLLGAPARNFVGWMICAPSDRPTPNSCRRLLCLPHAKPCRSGWGSAGQ